MTQHGTDRMDMEQPMMKTGYLLILLFLTLSGFGQMPIFKRYYIADIPGFGWLAKFFVTHYIHYMGAILLLGLIAYIAARYVLMDRRRKAVTGSGYLRGALLGGILITGACLVLRNVDGFWLPPGVIVFLNLAHLGLVVVFLAAALYCLVRKKKWTRIR